jgi:hypothetical protein
MALLDQCVSSVRGVREGEENGAKVLKVLEINIGEALVRAQFASRLREGGCSTEFGAKEKNMGHGEVATLRRVPPKANCPGSAAG